MRRPLVAGNAKMHLDRTGLRSLLTTIRSELERHPAAAEVLYCPAFPLLAEAERVLVGSPIHWGAQNLHWERSGAYTGEVSADMLRDAGCRYVLVGHSERRHGLGESDEVVRKKTAAALGAGLVPILCVGETEAERDEGRMLAVLERQVIRGLDGLPVRDPSAVVLAYEPVWAIGTGRTATPAEAGEAHAEVRRLVAEALGDPVAAGVRILYGGSVKPANAASLLAVPDIDGALVGGASLEAGSFLGIVRAAQG